MKSTEFLKLQIDNLVTENPSIKCRYEFNLNSSVHLIEVMPFSVYELNSKYVECEAKIVFSFIDNFPNENVCFISYDSLVKILSPSYTKAGLLFATINWHTSIEQKIEQIVPVRKVTTVHNDGILKFVFLDENVNKNKYNIEQSVIESDYTLPMAA